MLAVKGRNKPGLLIAVATERNYEFRGALTFAEANCKWICEIFFFVGCVGFVIFSGRKEASIENWFDSS